MHISSTQELDWPTLVSRVYPELRRVARALLSAERRGHTLEPTALVHEALMVLLDLEHPIEFLDDRHFVRLAVSRMRWQLIDHARRRLAAKRTIRLEPSSESCVPAERLEQMVTIDQLLTRLRSFDERSADIMELYYFGGLGDAEIAVVLGVSQRTVARDKDFAKAVLFRLANTVVCPAGQSLK